MHSVGILHQHSVLIFMRTRFRWGDYTARIGIADCRGATFKYRLLGTFYDDRLLINKIQVIPKRNTDPVFSGTIYIVEDQWCIHSLNLLVTKEAHLDFLDSLRFTETYGRVNDTAWMPFNQLLQFNISLLGFKGAGRFIGVFSKYNLAPGFSENFFDAERLKVKMTQTKIRCIGQSIS
jgi:hypothetical protein